MTRSGKLMRTRTQVCVLATTSICTAMAVIGGSLLLQMKQEGLTQKALAERMDCTQQYVSKILKGKENMSLDTLSKLEDALGINLIYDEQVAYPNMVAEEVFA